MEQHPRRTLVVRTHRREVLASQRSEDALKLEGEYAVENGYEVVPNSDAKALVAYLMSLDRSHALKEVKQEAPAK